MAFYVLDENKNLVLSFDAEGFLAILQQAIADQSLANIDPDSAVASKLRSIINGTVHHIEFVTAAQYSDLVNRGEIVAGTYYFITDDTTEEDLEAAIAQLQEGVSTLQTGKSVVYKHTITILVIVDNYNDVYYTIKGHIFNNSATALTTLPSIFADLIIDYGRYGGAAAGGSIIKCPEGFAYDQFDSPRAGFLFASQTGAFTFINPSTADSVSVTDLVDQL